MCVVVLYALACSLFVSDKIALLAISDTLALCRLLSDTLASCVYVWGRVVCVCMCVVVLYVLFRPNACDIIFVWLRG